jgi:hypothetical protein
MTAPGPTIELRVPEGAVADIRRELVPDLIALGAVDDEVEEAPVADGDEAAGASSTGKQDKAKDKAKADDKAKDKA